MSSLEQKIKDFAKEQGVPLVGIAGPDRLDGPPSLDPSYVLPGARSIVSLVVPMNVEAIYDFLSKRSHVPHNLDQTLWNQELMRIGTRLAGFIRSEGFRASAAPSNSDYRRSPDPWSLHPSFSHRLGAIASGVGGMGWSGNVKTEEFGAATYLGTVVTDAVLQSDPQRYRPRHFADKYCKKCRKCASSCVAQMYSKTEEEYVLVNSELHPRGKRVSIDLCEATCFGLHALSPDKKWSTWSVNWISDWVDKAPGTLNALQARKYLLQAGGAAGDSTPRFDLIRKTSHDIHPTDVIQSYLDLKPEQRTHEERLRMLRSFGKELGAARVKDFRNDLVLTCSNCALICGPDNAETMKRFRLLINSGIVAPGPGGEPVVVSTYEDAVRLRGENLPKVGALQKAVDGAYSGYLFQRGYLGIEPKSLAKGFLYKRRLKRAVRKKATGHAANPG